MQFPSNISMVPGTNELIYNNPGQGSNLFKQHGYGISRPSHRDYYNMLRHKQKGQQFFDDLGSLLLSLGGKVATAIGSQRSPAISSGSTRSAGLLAGSPTSTSFRTQPIGGFTSGELTESSYMGNPHRQRQYNELLNHLRYYAVPVPYGFNVAPGAVPPPVDYGQQQQQAIENTMPVDNNTIFGLNKTLVIGLAVVLAIALYIKMR